MIFLAQQNLPLRGHRESLHDYESSPGNFLSLVKLISNYDSVLKEHVMNVMNKVSKVSYFPHEIENEIVGILAQHIRHTIHHNVLECKYFSILFNSTPDISYKYQMSQVLRYT